MVIMGMGEKIIGQPVGVPQIFFQFPQIKGAHEGHSRIEENRGFPHEKIGRKSRAPQGVKLIRNFSCALLDHVFLPISKHTRL